jgi:23S rRNA pseudouridine2604 synthase
VDGRAMLPARASVNQTLPDATRLRLALKGYHPGQILQLCDQADLTLRGIRRIRVGRLPLRDLAPGQWRALMPYERF